MDIDNVKATIRKLLNLANDESAAKGEVENAMRFAARLMEQHQLGDDDLTEVDDILLDLERKEFAKEYAYTGSAKKSRWETDVADFACRLVGGVKNYLSAPYMVRENGIVVLGHNGSPLIRSQICFYGIAGDVEIARTVFAESIITIAAMARLKWGGVYRGPGRSYCEGFADALLNQLHDDKERLQQMSTGTALVAVENRNAIVKRKEELATDWLKSNGVKLSSYRGLGNGSHNNDAYDEGISDGARHRPNTALLRKLE